jgi:hypothetical protein
MTCFGHFEKLQMTPRSLINAPRDFKPIKTYYPLTGVEIDVYLPTTSSGNFACYSEDDMNASG